MSSLGFRWRRLKTNLLQKTGLRKKARSRRSMAQVNADQVSLKRAKIIRFGAIGGSSLIILSILLFFGLILVYSRELPSPGEVVRRDGYSTKILDRNGTLLFDLYDEENRLPVSINQVPQTLKDATIAIEDKDFYTHGGFDLLALLRAPYYLITQQRVVGGSTLTQQLVKKAMLTDERSVERKFKQIVLSMEIERKFTKDQILEMYLSEVPYGGTAYGVAAAAQAYFNKPISDLNLVESAILAGLPQRPSAYSPYSGKNDDDGTPLWQVRAKGVLRRMHEDGYITDLAYEEALGQLPDVQFDQGTVGINAPHFVFYVQDQLEEMYGEDFLSRGGLTVTTSLDLPIHDEAQQIVSEEIEKVEGLNITNGAAMVMDPRTGEIISMVGSRGFSHENIDGQFNVAVDGLRQPGSSIKPVVYLNLLRQGANPATMMIDVATTFQRNAKEKPYQPNNYDGKFRGPVSLRNSLGSSLNVPAVKAIALGGIENFLDQAYSMGFVTLEPTAENLKRLGLSVALGGGEVHLIDSATAFSSFANGGYRVEPVSILQIEDKDGKQIYEHRPIENQSVMSAEEAFLINHILSDDLARVIAFGANSGLKVSPYVAVKTGTTNDQRDNWAIGWSREVLVGAWVGNNDNSSMKTVASGISGATPIWRRIMLKALESGYDDPEWSVPEGVEQVEVDRVSGYPSHDGYETKMEYVIKNSLPSLPDLIHAKLKLCRGENKLANDARVAAGDYDEKEFIVLKEEDPLSEDGVNRWQEGINAWIGGQGDERFKFPTEYCGEQTEIFVDLKRPENEKSHDEENIEFEVQADAGDGIEKIEIFANGKKVETINSHSYKGKIKLEKGQYEVWAKAYSRSGKEQESGRKKIGTGGAGWEVMPPTPTPTKTPTPTTVLIPSPTPTLSPSLVPSPILSPTP